jgi:hypothetical protein
MKTGFGSSLIGNEGSGYALVRMNGLKAFVLHATLLSLFSEVFMLRIEIDLKIFYLVVLVNSFFIFATTTFFAHKKHFVLLFYLFLSGVIGVISQSTKLNHFLFAIIGISISSIYFYNYFRYVKIPVERVFSIYVRYATWLCWVGLAIFLYEIVVKGNWIRLHSIMGEPAHFAIVVIPAFVFLANQSIARKHLSLRFLVVTVALLFSNSTLAFIGIAISILQVIAGRSKTVFYRVAAVIVVAITMSLLFVTSYEFKTRVVDTLSVVSGGLTADANLSTYALLSNAHVAVESFKENPIIGGGLGSHPTSSAKYIRELQGFDEIEKTLSELYPGVGEELATLNYRDAASLFLRIMSELGFLGLLLSFYFLYKFRNSTNVLNNATFVYLLLKLFRDGHYFPPEMYFFVMVYILSSNTKLRIDATPMEWRIRS